VIRSAAFALVSLVAWTAAAETPAIPTAEGKKEAARLVDEGNRAFEAKRYADALERYNAAYALYPSPKILFNLAETHRFLGDALSAVRHYRDFLAAGGADAGTPAHGAARDRIAELEKELGSLSVTGELAGKVKIDGTEAGALPLRDVLVTPGEHELSVEMDGREVFRTKVALAAGEHIEVKAEQKALPAAVASSPPTDAVVSTPVAAAGDESLLEKWWFWAAIVGVVAGGVALGVGLSTGGGKFVPNGELGSTSTADWERL